MLRYDLTDKNMRYDLLSKKARTGVTLRGIRANYQGEYRLFEPRYGKKGEFKEDVRSGIHFRGFEVFAVGAYRFANRKTLFFIVHLEDFERCTQLYGNK